jgi:hypothetical protein
LLQLGKSLELQLTLPPTEFEQRVLASSQPPAHSGREAYSYLRLGDMLLRSQLDAAKDGRVFDLKTRATYAIRSNMANYASHVGYRLTRVRGPFSSFEREFYDMIRSAFIKYGAEAPLVLSRCRVTSRSRKPLRISSAHRSNGRHVCGIPQHTGAVWVRIHPAGGH